MPYRRPLIGIPTASFTGKDGRLVFRGYALYAQAVVDAGGAPIFVPLVQSEPDLLPIYEHLDGLLFPGGSDISPRRYGQSPIPECLEPDDPRDHVELRLARWALEDDKPILAICRGMQILNVAAGGTLYQDIETQLPSALNHRRGDARASIVHTIAIEQGSLLASIFPVDECGVNSSHHQAVKDTGRLFQVTARASDGVIEGMESNRHRFVAAIQWHPEELYLSEPRHKCLFQALIRVTTRT
jgi:putative glutamine amidotransferase